jgi:arabinofuranosyltransferase
VIGRFLSQAFASKAPLLAVDSAGCIPYFSGLPSLDMLGLNDAYLGHHPPEDFGESTSLGHELGNGPYVLGQKPDLVIFCLPGGGEKPCFRSGREMVLLDGFRDHYQLVGFEGEQPYRYRSLIWVRRDSDKIGVGASADRVTIPGYLVGDTTTTSRLDAAGRVATEIPSQARVSLPALALSAGRWSLTVDADKGEQLMVWVDAKAVDSRAVLDLADNAQIEISNPGSESVYLRSLVLARVVERAEASP